jgi:hypothetical protein
MSLKVAISGKMRSGKDTTAALLHRSTGAPIERFAGPLKKGLEILGCGDGEVIKDRQALQDIGTYFTDRDPLWWVNLFHDNTWWRDQRGIIIPDLRKLVEHEWCIENGIMTVRLQVSGDEQTRRGAPMEGREHWTETDLDDYLGVFHLVLNTDKLTPEQCEQMILQRWMELKREENDRVDEAVEQLRQKSLYEGFTTPVHG